MILRRSMIAPKLESPAVRYCGNLQNLSADVSLSQNEWAFFDSCKEKPKMAGQSPKRKSDAETGRNKKFKSSQQSERMSNNNEAYDWQSGEKGVKERLSYSLVNKVLCDAHFIVGKGAEIQKISAHKYILSISSIVFETMFSKNWSSKSEEIEIPDVEPAAFWALLRFIYADEVIITPDTVTAILYVAKKYALPALEKKCFDFLVFNLSSENAFSLLTEARSFDEQNLVDLCLKTIDANTADAVLADDFQDISLDTLCSVLNRDTLMISEVKLFKAVRRWAKVECARQGMPISGENLRTVLGEALYLVRFPLMTVEQLSSDVAPTEILTDRDLLSVFVYLTAPNPKPDVKFSNKSRAWKDLSVLTRFTTASAGWKCSGINEETIEFSCDRKIQMAGIGLYGGIHGRADYQVSIELVHAESDKTLYSDVGTYESDECGLTFKVLFKTPIKLKSHTQYIIKTKIKGPKSYYGSGGSNQVSLELFHGGKVTMTFENVSQSLSGANTTVNKGQIPQILFYL